MSAKSPFNDAEVAKLLAVALVLFGLRAYRARITRTEQIRAEVEERLMRLMSDEGASPADAALLLTDELVGERIGDRRYYEWATAETAARLVRTVIRAEAKKARRKKAKSSA